MKRINLLLAITFLFSILLPSCEKTVGVNSNGGGGNVSGGGRNWETHKFAYYNNAVVKISSAELTPEEEQAALANKTPYSIIYDENKYGPDASPYLKVLSAPAGTGGIWRVVAIKFNDLLKQRQFYNASEVIEAASGDKPLITLVVTDEFFELVPE
jgi:hypothetical protein